MTVCPPPFATSLGQSPGLAAVSLLTLSSATTPILLYINMPASTGLLVNTCSYTSLRPTSGMFIVHDWHLEVIGLSGHTLEQRKGTDYQLCAAGCI